MVSTQFLSSTIKQCLGTMFPMAVISQTVPFLYHTTINHHQPASGVASSSWDPPASGCTATTVWFVRKGDLESTNPHGNWSTFHQNLLGFLVKWMKFLIPRDPITFWEWVMEAKKLCWGGDWTPQSPSENMTGCLGYTLQGTNISPQNGILKMIFLFPRWDMLIPWRVLKYWKIHKTNDCDMFFSSKMICPVRSDL